jgi:hypothetical protein
MANPILKIKRGSGAPISLQTGELAMDLLNKSLFIGTATGPLAIGGEHVFAKKTYVDDAVSSEQSAREAADNTNSDAIYAEAQRAQDAEYGIQLGLIQETTDRTNAISSEQSAREAADTTLQSNIDAEKTRIDAILSAADADKDSFAEIVSLINSVDTENDNAFAGYVIENNAALAQEVTDRQSGDTTLQGNIDGVASDLSALTTRVSAAESDITDLGNDIAAETTARENAISSEQTSRQNAIDTLTTRVDAEESARATADTSLSNRLDALEGASADSRLTEVESDIADHETRISALETTIDGGSY